MTAYNINTGERVWRACSTGPDEELLLADNFNKAHPKYGRFGKGTKTWPGEEWKTGGGGMGHPLTDDVWKHGGDDATLMSLIKDDLAGSTMPKFGQALSKDQFWKILAYVRFLYQGDPALIQWQ